MLLSRSLFRGDTSKVLLIREFCSAHLPVIRLPRHVQLFAEKKSRQAGSERVITPRAGRLLIRARRAEFNQPVGETCGRWETPQLASRGWKHRLSRGDHFTIERTREQCSGPIETSTFQSLGLDPELITLLNSMGIQNPTWIQTRAIPLMMSGKNLVCAAETGTGKTLSYLLPILNQFFTGQPIDSSDPLNLILVPSKELASQITSVARALCPHLSVSMVCGGQGKTGLERQLSRGAIDILVATPGALQKALKKDLVSLFSLRSVILDEADTLFDDTFSDLVEDVLSHMRIASCEKEVCGVEKKTQLVVVGATFPSHAGQVLGKMTDLGKLTTVKSKSLQAEKVTELLNVLKNHAAENQGKGVLVFCKNSSTVNWLGYILDDHGIKHDRLQGSMPATMRVGIFRAFQRGQTSILVCTDLLSRGLDSLNVEIVVNYDFPPTIQDYIHRSGRVGRVGSKRQGRVISFVTHAWDVELVKKIETKVRRKASLMGNKSELDEAHHVEVSKEEHSSS
uniref:RNA helicase n=1 Tax=Leptobrachium leishanense TaxID=445787 RepID=A0A8C5PI45_9ANUR